MRIMVVGLLLNSTVLLLHPFVHFSDAALGLLQGAGIGIMIGGFIKIIKLRKGEEMC